MPGTKVRSAKKAQRLVRKRETCRSCGGRDLTMFLSLGEVPLANAFLKTADLSRPEKRFPLEVYWCSDCALVQLLHVVDPRVLFSRYLYRTGTNATISSHNAELARAVVARVKLQPNDLVTEIASNDGSLLQHFRMMGIRTLGVEPATNIARLARQEGITTLNKFFNLECAARIERRYGRVPVVIANNVLAHVDDTVGFLSACKAILSEHGRVVVEVPYLRELLKQLQYDTIYHEHLCYFSITALMRLYEAAGLAIEHVDHMDIHGGSLRIWARHRDSAGHGAGVRQAGEQEAAAGITKLPALAQFADRVARNRETLRNLLTGLRMQGKTVVAYGAPAKGNTLLCYTGVGAEEIPYTVDRSALKQGLHLPGSHIPIQPLERILTDQPDYVLILAWNFAPEIIRDLDLYRQRGGKFILPIPEPKIVSAA